MIDMLRQTPLKVHPGYASGPYLMVPLDQLAAVRAILDQHQVYYWVNELAISTHGSPFDIFINFGHKGNASAIQQILDAA